MHTHPTHMHTHTLHTCTHTPYTHAHTHPTHMHTHPTHMHIRTYHHAHHNVHTSCTCCLLTSNLVLEKPHWWLQAALGQETTVNALQQVQQSTLVVEDEWGCCYAIIAYHNHEVLVICKEGRRVGKGLVERVCLDVRCYSPPHATPAMLSSATL